MKSNINVAGNLGVTGTSTFYDNVNIKGNLGIGIIYFPINTNIQLTIGD